MSLRVKFFLILLLTAVAAVVAYPKEGRLLQALGIKNSDLKIQEGLDLQGGAQLTFEADLSGKSDEEKTRAVDGAIRVINNRVNPTGTSEVVVQKSGENRIIVSLPGEQDTQAAINRIGKTTQLKFLEVDPTTGVETDTGISGDDLASATADFDPTTGQPVIKFELKSAVVKQFEELSTKLNQTGGQLKIVLDERILFFGGVQSPIPNGQGVLQGLQNIAEAKEIAQDLNAGALPVPLKSVEQRTVGASLGREAVQQSLLAGIIGLGAVALFMILYYHLAGLVAVAALAIYTLVTLAFYKVSYFTPIPIVLTLAGIAGFILSIGMAVDANILIFERTKEEYRSGKSLLASLEAGFDRAWLSIRDSNVSTLITCFILYNFSGSVPIIKGFAVTLGVGVVLSMFTAIVVSRTFMRLLAQTNIGKNPGMYGYGTEREV